MPVSAKDALKVIRQFASVTDGSGYLMLVKKIIGLEPGTTAASLGKAGDAAHASGDVGVMALAVRKDTPTALAGSDGDYAPPEVDAVGRMYVQASNFRKVMDVVPVVSTTAYAAKDCVGGLMTFANAARYAGGSLVIENIILANKTTTITPDVDVDLVLFNALPATSFTDNAAFAPSSADLLKICGYVNLAFYSDFSANGIRQYTPVGGLGVVLDSAVTSLYGILVTRSVFTLAGTSDLQVRIIARQD